MKKNLLFNLLFLLGSLGAWAQTKNYNAAGKVPILSDKVHLQIEVVSDSLTKTNKESAGVLLGSLLPPVIDFGMTAIKSLNKRNALKYKAEYKASASKDAFFRDESHVNLPGLILTRQIVLKDGGRAVNAVSILLQPELSADRNAFRYRLQSVTYNYSIAKTRRSYDYIEAALDIKFKNVTINKNQYEVKDARITSIVIPMIKLGDTYTIDPKQPICSGWIPFPSKPVIEQTKDVTEGEIKRTVTEVTKNGVPQPAETTTQTTSTQKKQIKDLVVVNEKSGMYEIEITVTETNPYKIKAENKQQIIEDTSDPATNLLKTVVSTLTKPKEESKK